MNLSYFIAKRLAFSKEATFTKIIVRIAIVAVAISMAVMIVSSAMVTGFKKEITSKIFDFWGHIHVTDTQINTNFEQRPISIAEDFYQDLKAIDTITYQRYRGQSEEYETLETKGGVDHVQSYLILPSILTTKAKNFEAIMLKGVGSDFRWETLAPFIIEGRALQTDSDSLKDEILISKATANRILLSVGDKMILNFVQEGKRIRKRMTVAGIYNTGLEEYDRKFAITDIRKLQQVLDWREDQVGGVEVYVDNMDDLQVVSDYIYYDLLPPQMYAETIRQKFPNIFDWLDLQNINEWVIMGLMVIVAIINMITSLLILIIDRTKMIGILKSLGARDWSIRGIFLYYAAYIILWGLLLGNALGLFICWLQHKYQIIKLDEANYYVSVAPIEITLGNMLWINLGCFFVTLLFTVLPTYIVTRILPIKALRFG